MPNTNKYFQQIDDPNQVITAIDSALRFPEILGVLKAKYEEDIQVFRRLIQECESSTKLLERIRTNEFDAQRRMSLLKMFRRCVSPVMDTETTKKIKAISTEVLVGNYGHTFKPISKLRTQFSNISQDSLSALAALIGEYDTRGQLGYQLTDQFFNWFEDAFRGQLQIEGPRGAGRDIELREVFPDFEESSDSRVLAIGFARYDSTRGGAQSDDRTGGNSNKVDKAKKFCQATGKSFKLIFLSDGPGLAHRDTWEEACTLDGRWQGNVRVTTLKTAAERIRADWLRS